VLEGGFRGVHQLQDGAMAAALNIMRRLLGNTWCPDEVHLVTRDPRKPEAYAAFFGSPCRFNQACSELIFPASTLDLPVLAQSANPRDVVAATGDFGSQLDLADWPELVHRMVFSLLLKGGCNQTVLARSVGMTPRTLNRRLEQHGLSYRQILDDSRFSASRTLIRETDLPLEEIARALGYSRASSFTRAFTRWSGICPDLWRKAKRDVTR
jgi:AraC-like DNA-binding protein